VPDDPGLTAASVEYPAAFTCAIASANIFAVQFHPEKSHSAGLQLLANFVTWDGRV
jgi:glutamine amidotransferase